MIRRFLPIFASLFVLALTFFSLTGAVFAALSIQESQPITAVTIPPRMNARTGPGTGYPVVGFVAAGTKVKIIGENADGTWVRAEIDGFDGPVWLAKWLLNVAEGSAAAAQSRPQSNAAISQTTPLSATVAFSTTATAASVTEKPSAPAVDTSAGPVAVTTPARMNVRRGPGTAYPVATNAAAGTQARILGIGPDRQWYQVEMDGQSDKLWIFASLTTTHGSLEGVPQLTEAEIPPRPQPVAQPAPQAAAPAAAPVARAASLPGVGFGYGIQAHIIHTGQEGLAMDKTREMGFTWMKQQIEWRIFESNPGQYGFGDIGPIIGAADQRGINLLFSVVNAPDWARGPGFDANVGGPPADPQTLANFLGALAREYCGSSLKAIEVWNEQNLHYEWGNKPLNPAEYVALLRPAYASIKAACPSIYVISGAPTPAGDNGTLAMDDFRYLEEMFKQGVARYVDGIGAHPSGYNVPANVTWQAACAAIQQTGNSFNGACDNPHHSWSFRSTMEGYRNIAVVYGAGNIPIWPTEFGWAAGGAYHPAYAYANDNSYDEQAAWTVEAYQMMRNWGWVGPAFLWNLNFRVVADGTEKAQWGIVRNDWSPLPVYEALRGMGK
ncbi:MAG: SH3 domain-containing protein [Chloroflexi bacterium]|nr:SH3 domain-containing protein [Chloroflexota bacterium]